jgi:hypothetical protein
MIDWFYILYKLPFICVLENFFNLCGLGIPLAHVSLTELVIWLPLPEKGMGNEWKHTDFHSCSWATSLCAPDWVEHYVCEYVCTETAWPAVGQIPLGLVENKTTYIYTSRDKFFLNRTRGYCLERLQEEHWINRTLG